MLVSIIIPCYNSALYITETLDSVLSQTYTNWECIIVDDHSTDNSLGIIKQYIEKYPDKIKLFANPRKGACAARNFGFCVSKGEYIQFLDSDDIICSEKIEKQVEALIGSYEKLAVCNTWQFHININESYNTDAAFLFSTDNPEDLLIRLWGGNGRTNFIQTNAWLTPRKLIEENGPWDESLQKDQDGEFFARISLNSKGIIYVPVIKNYYRKHISGKSISSQLNNEHLQSNLKACELKANYLFSLTQSTIAKRAIATQFKIVAIEAWPRNIDIYKIAIKKSNRLGGSGYSPILGGRMIEIIKLLFGWRIAKWISYHGHKNKLLLRLFSKKQL